MEFEIESFLKFGYFLNNHINKDEHQIYLKTDDAVKNLLNSPSELFNHGYECLLKSIESDFKTNSKHVVPLSGGADSRLILAALSEFTEHKNIETYTFGTPGTYDYDFANRVSKSFNIKHRNIDLSSYEYTQESLEENCLHTKGLTLLFHNPPVNFLKQNYPDFQFWSGFMGGEVAGSHIQIDIDKVDEKLAERFIQSNKVSRSFFEINKNDVLNNLTLPEGDNRLTTYEAVDYLNRQLKFIKPHVCVDGFDFRTPFVKPIWSNFIYSLPISYRLKQRFFYDFCYARFPDYFNMPLKNFHGSSLPLNQFTYYKNRTKNLILSTLLPRDLYTDKRVNYSDYGRRMLMDKNFRNLLLENLNSLKSRSIIEPTVIDAIIKQHLSKNKNFGIEIMLLVSLEVILTCRSKGMRN